MGKKIKCSSTPRGRKSKDQRGVKKSKVVQLYTPRCFYHLKMLFFLTPDGVSQFIRAMVWTRAVASKFAIKVAMAVSAVVK